jgi:plastocyanin
MRGQVLRKVLGSTVFLGVMIFVFSVVFPPFEDVTAVNLSVHMLQHVLIVISGVLVAFPIYRRSRYSAAPGRWAGRAGLLLVGLLFVFWHLPGPWDSAVLDPIVHVAEHFSFLLGGILIGSVMQELSDSAKIGALLLAFFGHMAYAVVLISPWNVRVYPLYSLDQQVTLGWILLVTGGSFLAGVAYVLTRNPGWLQGATGKPIEPVPAVKAPRKESRHARIVASATSVILIITLLGYFGFTVLAIGSTSAEVPPHAAVVYISETPVSWQYAPQSIRVVIGTNNTVTWVSHSVSYDTVTGSSGNLSSGPIAPGQSFSYTFTEPGVYEYHCIYHPWMIGTVTVLARSG